ncbi:MAG TPA: endonuclease/exonuclease/phosphatase family protein [Paracoccaceae bacterium]|mgnify:CR=1 FL=1|nr:endonuclease/exonuclease/phosphatase family protein [Paracoccaceae bacterium]HMO72786.1 endonuclease/exonuclease/phosphatase family protein [Paracoccaceae bacterium]
MDAPHKPPTAVFDCATWNIHRARGADGRVDPARVNAAIARHLAAPPPAVLALTEADAERPPHAGLLDLPAIEAATGLVHAQGEPGLRWGAGSHGFLGTVLFLPPGWPLRDAALIDLPGHCPRGAVLVETEAQGAPLRIVATHLSLGQPLRIAQMRTIGQHLARRRPMPTLLIGDLNEWRPWGGLALSSRVTGLRFSGPALRSFPASLPTLPLDRILAAGGARVTAARALDAPDLRAASDHLPLRASVTIGQATSG